MTVRPLELLGGESVYCINEAQLRQATRLAYEDPETAPGIQKEIEALEQRMGRNERAALAFILIDRLLKTPAGP